MSTAKGKRKWLTAFVPHRLELMLSPAWQQAPRPLRRMLERLEIEHLRHGGLNNGELFVSFGQFVEFGISRRQVKSTMALGERLGLLEVYQEGGNSHGDIRAPNAYRLTYLPANGSKEPTDEWKSVTAVRVSALNATYQADEKLAARATRKEAA